MQLLYVSTVPDLSKVPISLYFSRLRLVHWKKHLDLAVCIQIFHILTTEMFSLSVQLKNASRLKTYLSQNPRESRAASEWQLLKIRNNCCPRSARKTCSTNKTQEFGCGCNFRYFLGGTQFDKEQEIKDASFPIKQRHDSWWKHVISFCPFHGN